MDWASDNHSSGRTRRRLRRPNAERLSNRSRNQSVSPSPQALFLGTGPRLSRFFFCRQSGAHLTFSAPPLWSLRLLSNSSKKPLFFDVLKVSSRHLPVERQVMKLSGEYSHLYSPQRPGGRRGRAERT